MRIKFKKIINNKQQKSKIMKKKIKIRFIFSNKSNRMNNQIPIRWKVRMIQANNKKIQAFNKTKSEYKTNYKNKVFF